MLFGPFCNPAATAATEATAATAATTATEATAATEATTATRISVEGEDQVEVMDMRSILALLEGVTGTDPDKHRPHNRNDDADGDKNPDGSRKPCLALDLWILRNSKTGGVSGARAAPLSSGRATGNTPGDGAGRNGSAGDIALVDRLDIDVPGIALIPFGHEYPEDQINKSS